MPCCCRQALGCKTGCIRALQCAHGGENECKPPSHLQRSASAAASASCSAASLPTAGWRLLRRQPTMAARRRREAALALLSAAAGLAALPPGPSATSSTEACGPAWAAAAPAGGLSRSAKTSGDCSRPGLMLDTVSSGEAKLMAWERGVPTPAGAAGSEAGGGNSVAGTCRQGTGTQQGLIKKDAG